MPAPAYRPDADLYPAHLYIYDESGRYGRPETLVDPQALSVAMFGPVRDAMAQRREVRITDPGDMLVFHAVDGKIVWPTQDDVAQASEGGS
jgi:hypothetical protein